MKTFIKQNLIFILLSSVCILIFSALLYFSLVLSSSTDTLISDINELKEELTDIEGQLSFYNHVDTDFKNVQDDLDKLSLTEKDITSFLRYIFNETENVSDKWSSKSAESVNASLTRLYSRLRKKCNDSYIKLPIQDSSDGSNGIFSENNKNSEDSSFGFSFTSYDGFWPSFSTEEARYLGIQTEIVKELVDHLSLCTDANHTIEILSLHRENVGLVDKANIGSDEIDISKVTNGLMRNLNEVDSFVFKLSIQTQTIPLRKLVNKLRPPFLIREIKISPLEQQMGLPDPSFSTPDPFSLETNPNDKFLPIVSKVDSRVELIFEYVTSAKRNLDPLIKTLSLYPEIYIDLLLEWLKDSGHESRVDSAKLIFNEKNIR